MKLSIVIPAYNEEERLPETLREVGRWAGKQERPVEVIVVDDGSIDRTGEMASEFGFVRLMRQKNQGKGGALRAGVLGATGDSILTMDADLCVPMEDLMGLQEALLEVDIAIGSRRAPGSRVESQPFLRQMAGRLFNLFVSHLVLPGFADTQCGFKLFRVDAARAVYGPLRTMGFGHDVEILCRARSFGLTVREVGVRWRHKERGSVSPLRDSVRMVRETWGLRRTAALGGDSHG